MRINDNDPSQTPITYREEAALYINAIKKEWRDWKRFWGRSPNWVKIFATLYLSMYVAMYIVLVSSMVYDSHRNPGPLKNPPLDVFFSSLWGAHVVLAPISLVSWILMLPGVPFQSKVVSWRFPFLRIGYVGVALYAAMFSVLFGLAFGGVGGDLNGIALYLVHGEAIALIATIMFAVLAPRLGMTMRGDEA
jgi:hypothetical protein